jgi:hypothetical protein
MASEVQRQSHPLEQSASYSHREAAARSQAVGFAALRPVTACQGIGAYKEDAQEGANCEHGEYETAAPWVEYARRAEGE